ncbi:hypothetical protein CcCBS67573_g00909 [Chytriomyces confervae]|uniref:Uncharacterized protein n=1 Tax=Chytriomyces confervae TaxID=246404 RepID=A0A507FN57_9FUNG|nr:Actin-like 6A [Chytriomyces hyalinus]TPX77849.1 hypothetical protein CcCBS67573_g00909 [Chytriomyces confervae]
MATGDDVSAIIIDAGSGFVRAGYAGEDCPRAVFPSAVGRVPNAPASASASAPTPANPAAASVESGGDTSAAPSASSFSPYLVGESRVYAWRENMQIQSPFSNGIVTDWDALEAIWEYTYSDRLGVSANEHPLLVTEAAWSTRDVREKLIEIAFEKFRVPAFYIAKAPVLAAYTAGRPTALVIDSGAEMTSVVPVVDGFVIKKAIQKQNVAGNAVSNFARALLEANNIPVVPHYMVKKKLPVDAGHGSNPENRPPVPGTTKSFHDFATHRVLTEFKETVCQISEYNFHQQSLAMKPVKPFEFPDGYNCSFGLERFRIPEMLFNPSVNPAFSDTLVTGLHQMILSSLSACDADVRANVFQNVVITGGNSLIPGFVDRLNNTMSQNVGIRHRLYTPASQAERKYATWIGGSILASLGNFHQMWVSAAEYAEKGVAVEKRLP